MKFSPAEWIGKLSSRERVIFYVTAAFIFVFLVQVVVLSPILNKLADLDDAIATHQEKVKKSLEISSRQPEIDRQKELYGTVFSDLPTEEEVASFLRDIEGLAKDCGVYLIDVQPGAQVTKGVGKEYSMEMNFEAKMEQVFKFFYEMSRADKLIKIVRYQVRPKSQDSSVAVCNLSVAKLVISK